MIFFWGSGLDGMKGSPAGETPHGAAVGRLVARPKQQRLAAPAVVDEVVLSPAERAAVGRRRLAFVAQGHALICAKRRQRMQLAALPVTEHTRNLVQPRRAGLGFGPGNYGNEDGFSDVVLKWFLFHDEVLVKAGATVPSLFPPQPEPRLSQKNAA